jgi:hypothetical protein
VKESLFIHRLRRPGDVIAALFELSVWCAARAEQILERGAQPYRPRDEAKVEVGLPRAAGIALFWLSSACPGRR